MPDRDPDQRAAPGPIGRFHRDVLRSWRRKLLASGFTERQAAGLIIAKLLYIRGKLRG